MNKLDKMRELFQENGLDQEDIFKMRLGGKEIPIITRTGIEKIQAKNNIKVQYELLRVSEDHKYAIIKATAKADKRFNVIKDGKVETVIDNVTIETFGEASPSNAKQSYPIAMAEKRALSRAVLKIAGLYELGVFGEDESEDFKKSNES